MEALFLLLTGGVLFSHSWYLLGLYTDGKNMGLITAALAGGLAAVALGVFSPVALPASLDSGAVNPAIIPIQAYAVLWAVYGGAVAAHGLWDFDERPIGFFALFLAAASLVYLVGLGAGGFTAAQAPDSVGIALAAGSLVLLGTLASVVFVHLAVPFRGLRPVAGWFLLVGSVVISLAGLSVLFDMVGLAIA